MKRKKKILIVEDEAPIARGLKDLLQSEDYAVSIVSNGRETVKKVRTLHPHLVLLDINLPDITGLEVCRQLRASGFAQPIMMLTSRVEQVDKIIGLDAGADDYVTKPFDSRELLTRVRAHLRRVERLPEPGSSLLAATPLPREKRRLLAVMFTDIKGFAGKMNADEQRALKLLNIHNAIVQKAVRQAGGRVVEIIGDAFLVAFESALRAVECAVAIQHSLRKRNQSALKQNQISVRIGIHLGDVLEVGEKLRGDTINIAARLQQMAGAGHVNVSEGVFEIIKGRTKIKAVRLGRRKVKNIKQPITVYRLSV